MKIIQTTNAPAAIGPYSQAVMGGEWLFLSGQIGIDPATGKLENDFARQARRSLLNLFGVLKEAGLSAKDIASVDIFLTDMNQFQSLNKIYEEFFPTYKPARLAVEVRALPGGAAVEIRCLARAIASD
jgi:2-iminobutanoate/2-iminopropanoate deaminase